MTCTGEFRVWGRDWHGQLEAFHAFGKGEEFLLGPRRDMFETLRETGWKKKSGLLCLRDANMGMLEAAGEDSDSSGSIPSLGDGYEESIPPPPDEAEAEAFEEEALEEVEEANWDVLLQAWR